MEGGRDVGVRKEGGAGWNKEGGSQTRGRMHEIRKKG